MACNWRTSSWTAVDLGEDFDRLPICDRASRGWVTGADRGREARGSDRQRAPEQRLRPCRFQGGASVVLSSGGLAPRQQGERAVERHSADPDRRRRWQRIGDRLSVCRVRVAKERQKLSAVLRELLAVRSDQYRGGRAPPAPAPAPPGPAVGFDAAGVATGTRRRTCCGSRRRWAGSGWTVDSGIARCASGEPGHRQRRGSEAETDDHPAGPLGWRNGPSECI